MNAILDTAEQTSHPNRTLKCLVSCQSLSAQLEQTKDDILAEFSNALETHDQLLRLALNEAEALAWQTTYPQLVFPTLALEKARAVSAWYERQQRLLGSVSFARLAA